MVRLGPGRYDYHGFTIIAQPYTITLNFGLDTCQIKV